MAPLISGTNDLGTLHPELARQLVDPDLARTLRPSTHRKVEWKCDRGHVWSAAVGNRVRKGYGCPYCSGRRAIPGETDLATTHPHLAAELVDQSLGTEIGFGSIRRVEWTCGEGHTWTTTPNHRSNRKSGCPYCAGQRPVKGVNDLATMRPDLAAELVDPSLAGALLVYSNKRVSWRCERNHEWITSVQHRVRDGNGCPYCSGRRAIPGETDLATVRPDLVKELVDPSVGVEVSPHSDRKLEWRCDLGHIYAAQVKARTRGGGCPTCAPYGFRPGLPAWFYVVTDHDVIKCGITNDLGQRLTQHSRQRVSTVIGHLYFEDGMDALRMEREWMAYVKSRPEYAVTRGRIRSGWTEALQVHEGLQDFVAGLLARWRDRATEMAP